MMDYQIVTSLITDSKSVSNNYRENQKEHIEDQFNIFKLISKKYHYENFHSDIIYHLLNPNSNHNQGAVFLNEFISLLREKDGSILNFTEPLVYKESGRIDILIRDKSSKRSIIIENKINDAIDQENQLLRYFEREEKGGYSVIAVVYLSIDGKKQPPLLAEKVKNKLIILAVIDGTNSNLYIWLTSCINKVDEKHIEVFITQYSYLFKILSKQIMDYDILENFYKIINKDPQSYETAIQISNMVKHLPIFIAQKFANEYDNVYSDIFGKIMYYSEGDRHWAVLQDCKLLSEDFNLTIDLEVLNPEFIEVSIFERDKNILDDESKLPLDKLSVINNELNFNFENGRYRKSFNFPSEKREMDELIENIVFDLRKLKNQSPASQPGFDL